MINVGVIGSGFIVPRFLETTKQIKGYHVKAISSPHSYERLKELKDTYEVDYVTLNYKDLLKDEDIDLIYIASPNSFHYIQSKEALLSGKNVLCEKPFTKSYEQAKELIDLAVSRGQLIYEAIMTPALPMYHKIRELLVENEVKTVELNFSQYSHRYDDFKKGIIKPVFNKQMDGGALMDLNVYNISFTIGLFGEPLNVEYFPTIEQEIDVGGKLILSYPQFEASLLAYKNKQGPTYIDLITTKGIIHSDNPASIIASIKFNDEAYESKEHTNYYYELEEFRRVYEEKDIQAIKYHNNLTLCVVKVLEKGLKSAGLDK